VEVQTLRDPTGLQTLRAPLLLALVVVHMAEGARGRRPVEAVRTRPRQSSDTVSSESSTGAEQGRREAAGGTPQRTRLALHMTPRLSLLKKRQGDTLPLLLAVAASDPSRSGGGGAQVLDVQGRPGRLAAKPGAQGARVEGAAAQVAQANGADAFAATGEARSGEEG